MADGAGEELLCYEYPGVKVAITGRWREMLPNSTRFQCHLRRLRSTKSKRGKFSTHIRYIWFTIGCNLTFETIGVTRLQSCCILGVVTDEIDGQPASSKECRQNGRRGSSDSLLIIDYSEASTGRRQAFKPTEPFERHSPPQP